MPERNPPAPDIGAMHLETPVIDVESIKITPSMDGEVRDDEREIEEAIAAIERLEKSMRN